MIKRYWMLWFYIAITVSVFVSFMGPLKFEHTTLGIIVGTIITTVGAAFIAAIPSYLMAAALSGIIRLPKILHNLVSMSAYVLAGTPSIILGVIGFLIFSITFGFGWSMLSAMLTLILLLYPTMVVAFTQLLTPLNEQYKNFSRSFGIGPLEFCFRSVPSYQKKQLTEVLILGWATSLGDTAAVMLTCGALTEFPESLMDSVRILNYHIFLLAMEVPGGMPEARTLSLLLVVTLIVLLATPRLIFYRFAR